MSMLALAQDGADPLLRRLPGAVWRALPVLVLTGLGLAASTTLALWVTGTVPALSAVVAAVLGAPILLWGVDGMHRELFRDRTAVPWVRRWVRVTVAAALPAVLASSSMAMAGAADAARSWALQVLAVAFVLLALVAAAVGAVAIPVAAWRGDVSARSIATFALVATIRRPLGAVAALAVPLALVWLGLTAFAGLLVLVGPVLVVLLVGASWTTVRPAGAALPELALVRARRNRTDEALLVEERKSQEEDR